MHYMVIYITYYIMAYNINTLFSWKKRLHNPHIQAMETLRSTETHFYRSRAGRSTVWGNLISVGRRVGWGRVNDNK